MEHKIHNFPSQILVDETIEQYGYHPDKYGPGSLKFVLANCRYCGQLAPIRKAFFNKAGSACHKECRLKEQTHFSPFKNSETRKKSKLTNLQRYGYEYASQNKDIAKKISLAKYKKAPAFTDIIDKLKSWDMAYRVKENIIYIPDKNFAIACHLNSELVKPANNRLCITQTKKCRSNHIRLFHIFSHQWARKVQILNFIKTILGLNSIKVPGRKCIIDFSSQPDFIEHNHIQGKTHAVLRYFNLMYDGEIIASMTASKHHRQNSDTKSIVLSRLCFADGINIQGGSSKLFKQFVKWAKSEGYDNIISWSDNCWTEGKIYRVLGFTLTREYSPDYFYWSTSQSKHFSKQTQQKKLTGCPEGMTEHEWCIERGLFRIMDCGKKKWEYSL